VSESKGKGIVSFAENRFYIAMVEASWYGIVSIVVAFAFFKLFLTAKASSNETTTTILFILAILVIPCTIATIALRIKFTVKRASDEISISNLWSGCRIKCGSVTGISAGDYRPLYKIGPRLRVVIVSYTDESGLRVKSVPLVASYSRGKPSKLLDEVIRTSTRYSIPCELSRMIY
jgi:hypothetical protein